MLYIVGSPIGNLKDITLRAIEILKSVDIILAEDTRRTKILLDHYGITTNTSDVRLRLRHTSDVDAKVKLVSFHEHASQEKIDWVIRELKSGKDIALVSDAGTPGVADPGGRLIGQVKSQKLKVKIIPIPGPSALTSILSISGVQNEPCLFLGYLPKKKGRQTLLKELGKLEVRKVRGRTFIKTLVLFESPQRIQKTIKDLFETFGAESKIVVGRELTKQFEEIIWTTLDQATERSWSTKGEYTILVSIFKF